MKNDVALHQDVLIPLTKEPSMDVARSGVIVKDAAARSTAQLSTAQLCTGADQRALRHSLQRIAASPGIAVAVDISPASVQERDAKLSVAAASALEDDTGVPCKRLNIEVDGGWLTLRGEVGCPEQKLNAALDIEALAGLRGFTNAIVVKAVVDAGEEQRARAPRTSRAKHA